MGSTNLKVLNSAGNSLFGAAVHRFQSREFTLYVCCVNLSITQLRPWELILFFPKKEKRMAGTTPPW